MKRRLACGIKEKLVLEGTCPAAAPKGESPPLVYAIFPAEGVCDINIRKKMSRLKVWSTIILTEESAGLLILWRIVRIISAISAFEIYALFVICQPRNERRKERNFVEFVGVNCDFFSSFDLYTDKKNLNR